MIVFFVVRFLPGMAMLLCGRIVALSFFVWLILRLFVYMVVLMFVCLLVSLFGQLFLRCFVRSLICSSVGLSLSLIVCVSFGVCVVSCWAVVLLYCLCPGVLL